MTLHNINVLVTHISICCVPIGKAKEPDPVGFFSIEHEGIVTDVYWNRQYVIIKCIQSENDATKYRYIMKNTEDYDWKELEVRQFLNVMDYKMAIDSLGLSENKMEHTDGTIPWRIF